MNRSFYTLPGNASWGIIQILAIAAGLISLLQFTILPELIENAAGVFLYMGNGWKIADTQEIILYQFLHGSIFHLLGNMFMLVYIGSILEQNIGKKWIIGLFIGTTLAVYIAIILFSRSPVIGMSGFCLAVFTMYAEIERQKRNPEAKTAYIFIFLNIALGVIGDISLVGHLFGALCGYIGATLYRNK